MYNVYILNKKSVFIKNCARLLKVLNFAYIPENNNFQKVCLRAKKQHFQKKCVFLILSSFYFKGKNSLN